MASEFIRTIEIGKTNKYNNPYRTFTDKDGKQTIYRFFYPSNDRILEKVIDIVEQSFIRELTEQEFSFLVSCVWIVEHKSTAKQHSKLDGLKSISTSCLDNRFCLCRMQDSTSICHDCYAGTQQERQHGLQEHNVINGLILRNVLIPVEYWKQLALFNEKFVRIESFGDVQNETQAENYIRIMQAFGNATFAVWTKTYLFGLEFLSNAANRKIAFSLFQVATKTSLQPCKTTSKPLLIMFSRFIQKNSSAKTILKSIAVGVPAKIALHKANAVISTTQSISSVNN